MTLEPGWGRVWRLIRFDAIAGLGACTSSPRRCRAHPALARHREHPRYTIIGWFASLSMIGIEMMFNAKENPKDDLSDIVASLEEMARSAELGALAKAPDLFAEYVAEHRAQSGGYHFECHRFGDFLTIKVRRDANKIPEHYWGEKPLSKLSASINLARVTKVTIAEGHAPDHKGELTYRFSLVRDPSDGISWSSSDQFLKRGETYAVAPKYPYLPKWRPLLASPSPKQDATGGMQYYGDRPHEIKLRTPNFPRPANDDLITFEGLGEKLWIPAGMGEAIMAEIMAEIERGYEKPPIPNAPNPAPSPAT